MRYALMNHEIFPRFAEDISTYMVNTLLKTTDVAMEHKAKKALVKSFINPELCEITEDLVLTEPYNDCNHRNNVFPPIAGFVKRELYEDEALKLAVAKIKFEFMNNAQALIHGDLHTAPSSCARIPPACLILNLPSTALWGMILATLWPI